MVKYPTSFCITSDGPHPGHGDNFVQFTILFSQPNLLFVLQLYWEPIPGPNSIVCTVKLNTKEQTQSRKFTNKE